MANCLFHKGDKVKMKSKEDVVSLANYYLKDASNYYINEVTELCNGVYTVNYCVDEAYCGLDTHSIFFEEEETEIGWKLFQDYFDLYFEQESDNAIPDLFG